MADIVENIGPGLSAGEIYLRTRLHSDLAFTSVLASRIAGLSTTSVLLEEADILALHSSPAVLIPAPGAGRVVVPITFMEQTKYLGDPYTVADVPTYQWDALDIDYATLAVSLVAARDQIAPIPARPLMQDFGANDLADLEDKAFVLQAASDPTDGTSQLFIAIVFTSLTLI
jgi:hypothetical protein